MFSAAEVITNSENKTDEITDLWIKYRESGNLEIRNRLVLNYIGLVKKIAFKIYKTTKFVESTDELINEGVLAIISSIDRFDMDQNVKFETFVSRRVQGAMLDYIHKQSGFVRRIHELSKKINEAKNEFYACNGRMPSDKETAKILHMTDAEYSDAVKQTQTIYTVSLYQSEKDFDDNTKLIDIPSDNADDPIEIIAGKEYNENLVKAIEKLNEQQQLVLSLFYKDEFSVREIADVMGLATEQVSQIRFQAIKKLKKFASEFSVRI